MVAQLPFASLARLAYNRCHLSPSDIMPTPEYMARQNSADLLMKTYCAVPITHIRRGINEVLCITGSRGVSDEKAMAYG